MDGKMIVWGDEPGETVEIRVSTEIDYSHERTIINFARTTYGKPWTSTNKDCAAIKAYLATGDKEFLGNWEGSASLITLIHEMIQ